MNELRDKTNEDFANYLDMLADDFDESGSDTTADDYREAARRIRELNAFFEIDS